MEQEQEKSTEMCSENTNADTTQQKTSLSDILADFQGQHATGETPAEEQPEADSSEPEATVQCAPGVCKITNATPEMLAELFKRIAEENEKWIAENTCEPLPDVVSQKIDESNSIIDDVLIPSYVLDAYKEANTYLDRYAALEIIMDQNHKFWFYGYCIARILKYDNASYIVAKVCKHQQWMYPSNRHPDSGNIIISESDVVRLIEYAHTATQMKIKYVFADWLFDTALPDLCAQHCAYPHVEDMPLSQKLIAYAKLLEVVKQHRESLINDLKKEI